MCHDGGFFKDNLATSFTQEINNSIKNENEKRHFLCAILYNPETGITVLN